MKPYQLLGRKYRVGADFVSRSEGDCLSLVAVVMAHYGIDFPDPQRAWYRRYLRGDADVFRDELQKWGHLTNDIECGTVALCRAYDGFGLASFYEDGWISFIGLEVRWSPLEALQVVELYCPRKSNSATS